MADIEFPCRRSRKPTTLGTEVVLSSSIEAMRGERMKTMKKLVLAGVLVVMAGCGSGTESTGSEARNVALPTGVVTKQAVAIAAGPEHNCVITNKWTVECWGSNSRGELGRSTTTTYSARPLQVPGLPTNNKAVRIVSNSRAHHTCAIFLNGDLYCWGDSQEWQVVEMAGDNTVSPPVRVATDVIDVALSQDATCSVDNRHRVQCWGLRRWGQLGDDGRFEASRVVSRRMIGTSYVATQGRVVQIVGGVGHFCVLYDDQTVDCWGNNQVTQAAGNVTASEIVPVPAQVLGLPAIAAITASFGHTCAVDVRGEIWCWGRGWTTLSDNGPVKVAYATQSGGNSDQSRTAQSIFAGEVETCVVDTGGAVSCFNEDGGGLWTNDNDSGIREAIVVDDLRQVAVGALGVRHICIVTQFGLPECRGFNGAGQSGLDPSQFPEVSQLTAVSSFVASNTVLDFSRSSFLITTDFGLIGGGEAGSVVSTPPIVDDGSTPLASSTTVAGGTTTTVAGGTATTAKIYTMKVRRTASSRTLARWAGLKVSKGSKVSFTVARGSARKCAKSAGKLRATRTGTCKVRVKVTKKGAKARTKTVSITIVR